MSSANRFVTGLLVVLSGSAALFGITGYLALLHAWARSDLESAVPLLPWARNSGLLAVACASLAFGLLFSTNRYPLSPKRRLALSGAAAGTITLFSEFRNEGKFYFANLHHFSAPGEWLHRGLNFLAPPLGDFLYRIEFSHWNDFLIGPAIVCVTFSVVFLSIYNAHARRGQAVSLRTGAEEDSPELEIKLRSARIVMYVGLLWFFLQAWGEKAGYIPNPHSRDAIDLPFEFAGIALGFWMARVLTKPFHPLPERFSSTLLHDLVASGVIGLTYTLLVGPVTQSVTRSVAHALYVDVPESLEVSQYTALEQRMRPLELLVLAAATWWICNRLVGPRPPQGAEDAEGDSNQPRMLRLVTPLAIAIAVAAVHLCMLGAIVWVLEPQGRGLTLALLAGGIGAGAGTIFLVRRMGRRGLATLFSEK